MTLWMLCEHGLSRSHLTLSVEDIRIGCEGGHSPTIADLVSALRAEGVLDKRLFVTSEEYQAQRDANWPEFHPEIYCQLCFCHNVKSWYVDSSVWNVTSLRPSMIVCPQCFTEAHAEATGDWQTWEIRPASTESDQNGARDVVEPWPCAHGLMYSHVLNPEAVGNPDLTPIVCVGRPAKAQPFPPAGG